MSTPTTADDIGGYKVNDRARMVRNAHPFSGTSGSIRGLDRDHGWRVWVHPDGAPYDFAMHMDPDDLERIEKTTVTVTTPAPLDPSKVKAGDTVTLSLEGSHVTDVVAAWEHNPASDHYRAYLTHDPDPFDAKPFRLVGNTAYSLTDHQPAPEPVDERIEAWERVAQHPVFTSAYDGEGPLLDSMMAVLDRIAHQPAPAPEPEPEWKPGTSGTAEVVREGANGGPRMFRRTRGMVVHRPAPIDDDMFVTTEGELWGLEGEYCKDFVPDEPRPLPSREQVRKAVWHAAHDDALVRTIEEVTDAVLALLRGESR